LSNHTSVFYITNYKDQQEARHIIQEISMTFILVCVYKAIF